VTEAAAPLWSPTPEAVDRANLTRFTARFRPGADYQQLHRWSVERPDEFWAAVWEFGEVLADRDASGRQWDSVLVGAERMAPPDPVNGPHWFRGARLNFAENLLRHGDDRPALVWWDETGRKGSLTFAELRREVARWQLALRAEEVGVGDRVAAMLPNCPEAVVAMLATTSLGAVWSSCSPDFGEGAVLDRFGQIAPTVFISAAGCRYNGKPIDLLPRLANVAARLQAPRRLVVIGESPASSPIPGDARAVWHGSWLPPVDASPAAPAYVRLPFDHPVYILYSSGTTGLPKAIVHGAGGTLLQHLKELMLHTDLTRDDRIFYYTTCGWMMWNWVVTSLAVGATVVLYDGAPLSPRPEILWDLAQQERVTVFGTSAKYLALCEKAPLEPARSHQLPALRAILSTGSPLAQHSYDYVYSQIKREVHLASISGGTDIVSCFALGNPTLPVWRGELQCRGLGMAVDVFDPSGKPLAGAPGELVCTRPFPSMPVAFWDDPDGRKYRAAYFEHFPGVWRHGDWAERTGHDGLIIYGRSDATLNPGGVRIGTAEIYRQVERLPEIVESLVIAQDWENDVRVVLFVRLREGLVLDEPLRDRIRREIRTHASPHHVPRKILQVPDLPRTINGKLSELAVRAAVHGRAIGNREALANPQALDLFQNLPELAV
jgi:acetoacetyl-CoA synthetase